MGNKTAIEKQRRGLEEESGFYTYGYDALGRLNAVAKNGGTLRNYEYDAFGNRSLLKEGGRETAYIYILKLYPENISRKLLTLKLLFFDKKIERPQEGLEAHFYGTYTWRLAGTKNFEVCPE